MNLIAYSDSEDSGDDAPAAPKVAAKPAPKPAFQKVVDRSNPGRIKLNLPGASHPQTEKDDIEAEAPPAKKARTGGGAFGGFNAMLPAPKKPKVDAATGGAMPGKRGTGKGLGAGVNLKTGAEPAFKREPRIEEEEYDENGNPVKREALKKEDFRAMLNLPTPKSQTEVKTQPEPKVEVTKGPLVSKSKPAARPKFMPMSVARGKKKKPAVPKPSTTAAENPSISAALSSNAAAATTEAKPATQRPKVSLFSISQETEAPTRPSNGNYEPLLYGAEEEEDAPIPDDAFEAHTTYQQHPTPATITNAAPSNDLTSIASELNLSEAEKRQLFGRKGQGPDLSSAKLMEFNTDAEYAHNEFLRQQGETVQHNALKSITGTGKNSLRSLVNVAVTQKDALEDHFAAGKRNKKEAGNKYGW